jgi:hypothetical protein
MGGLPKLQTVTYTEIVSSTKDVQILQMKSWLHVVLCSSYQRGDNSGVTHHFKSHQKHQQYF